MRSAIARSSSRLAASSPTRRPRRWRSAHRAAASTTSSARSRWAQSRHARRPSMRNVMILFRREFASYFATPLALVFIVIFLVAAGALTFGLGGFYARGQADLAPFFNYHPWLYLLLMPALSMRLWSEE